MHEKKSHCSYCGQRFPENAPWPRAYAGCTKTSFVNPLPVAVLVLPVGDGVLVVRRAIPPRQGQLALPGGYINLGESWQAAAAREVFEETGVRVDPTKIRDLRVLSAPDGTVLIFGVAAPCAEADLPPFEPTSETSERTVLRAPAELAFPLHTQVLREFFAQNDHGIR